jgi:polysaccharide pyruvyl transferase WcaK-like protein
MGLEPEGRYLAFLLRPWQGFEERAPVFAAAAAYIYHTRGITPVFFPIEPRLDVDAARKLTQTLGGIPYHLITESFTPAETIGFLSRMQAVVSMRLHGLIFAAGQGVPLVGVVYDPKVRAFLEYIGQDLYVDLADSTAEGLQALISRALARRADTAFLAEGVKKLRAVEAANSEAAASLLGEAARQ